MGFGKRGSLRLARVADRISPAVKRFGLGGIDNTRSLPASRFHVKDERLSIDPAFSLPKDAHGACVVAVRDGKLIAIIAIEAGQARLINIGPVLAR